MISLSAVVIFAEDTPLRLIETIRPDLLVKGSDYSIENVIGANFVQSYGGQILLCHPAYLTTAISNRDILPGPPCGQAREMPALRYFTDPGCALRLLDGPPGARYT